VVIYNR